MNLEELVELAMESESVDIINWDELNLDKRAAYTLMATHVLERSTEFSREVMMASLTHLLVENFVLNLTRLKKS